MLDLLTAKTAAICLWISPGVWTFTGQMDTNVCMFKVQMTLHRHCSSTEELRTVYHDGMCCNLGYAADVDFSALLSGVSHCVLSILMQQ